MWRIRGPLRRIAFGRASRATFQKRPQNVHNHPSGDPTPSKADIALTVQLAHGARILGFEVVDHVIVGGDRHVSLADAEPGVFV